MFAFTTVLSGLVGVSIGLFFNVGKEVQGAMAASGAAAGKVDFVENLITWFPTNIVEAMATAPVPKLVLTVNHASGAGYYAMAGQGFDPDFVFTLPTGRMGVMEGDSAVQAMFGTQLDKLKAANEAIPAELEDQMQKVRETYDKELDAKHAAARGLVDAIVVPEHLRETLVLALETCGNTRTPHIGPFVL